MRIIHGHLESSTTHEESNPLSIFYKFSTWFAKFAKILSFQAATQLWALVRKVELGGRASWSIPGLMETLGRTNATPLEVISLPHSHIDVNKLSHSQQISNFISLQKLRLWLQWLRTSSLSQPCWVLLGRAGTRPPVVCQALKPPSLTNFDKTCGLRRQWGCSQDSSIRS